MISSLSSLTSETVAPAQSHGIRACKCALSGSRLTPFDSLQPTHGRAFKSVGISIVMEKEPWDYGGLSFIHSLIHSFISHL